LEVAREGRERPSFVQEVEQAGHRIIAKQTHHRCI